jgi:hypothetical protein
MPVTIDQFLEDLKETRGTLAWGLVPDTSWAADRRAWPRYRIRAQSDDEAAGVFVFDPIGAVCYSKTGNVHGEDEWAEAAAEIGLSKEDGQRLYDAANDRTWSGPEGNRHPVRELQELRVRLIEAVEETGDRIIQSDRNEGVLRRS